MLDPRWWDLIFDQLSLSNQRNLGLTCKTLYGLLSKKELKTKYAQLYYEYLEKEQWRVFRGEQRRMDEEHQRRIVEEKQRKVAEEAEQCRKIEEKKKKKIKKCKVFLPLLLTFSLLFTLVCGLFIGPFNCLEVGNKSCFGKALVGIVVSNYHNTSMSYTCTVEFELEEENIVKVDLLSPSTCQDFIIGTKQGIIKNPKTGRYNLAELSEGIRDIPFAIYFVCIFLTIIGSISIVVILCFWGLNKKYCCGSCHHSEIV